MIAFPAGRLTEMVGQYVTEKTGMPFTPGMYQAFMVVNDDHDFVAGIVLSEHRGHDIHVSAASDSRFAATPGVCRAVFKYVFDQLGCARCTAITSKSNRKGRAFIEALGFELEGNLRLGYDGRRDALVYGLLRSDCRFLAADSEREKLDGDEEPDRASAPGPGGDGAGASGDQSERGGNASEPEQDRSVHAAG